MRDYAPQWQGTLQSLAYQWLAVKDKEAKERDEAAGMLQMKVATRTYWAAVIAAIISLLGVGISLLAWLYPRH